MTRMPEDLTQWPEAGQVNGGNYYTAKAEKTQ